MLHFTKSRNTSRERINKNPVEFEGNHYDYQDSFLDKKEAIAYARKYEKDALVNEQLINGKSNYVIFALREKKMAEGGVLTAEKNLIYKMFTLVKIWDYFSQRTGITVKFHDFNVGNYTEDIWESEPITEHQFNKLIANGFRVLNVFNPKSGAQVRIYCYYYPYLNAASFAIKSDSRKQNFLEITIPEIKKNSGGGITKPSGSTKADELRSLIESFGITGNTDFIFSVLINDENSTDDELAAYFKEELKLTDEQVQKIISFRSYFLKGEYLRDSANDSPITDNRLPIADIHAAGGAVGDSAKVLIISSEHPLSTQLVKLTGDSFNNIDFEDLENASNLNVLKHKKSGQLFVVFIDNYFIQVDKHVIHDDLNYVRDRYSIAKFEWVRKPSYAMDDSGMPLIKKEEGGILNSQLPTIDEDSVAQRILTEHGFLTGNESATDNFSDAAETYIAKVGYKGKVAGVALIEGGAYKNPMLITKKILRDIAEHVSIKGVEKIELYTNAGVELHSDELRQPEWRNWTIHKVGEGYTYGEGGLLMMKYPLSIPNRDAQAIYDMFTDGDITKAEAIEEAKFALEVEGSIEDTDYYKLIDLINEYHYAAGGAVELSESEQQKKQVAQEIYRQLGKQTMFMLGAFNIFYDSNSKYGALEFRIRGSKKWKHIKIALNGLDTYDVTFTTWHRTKDSENMKREVVEGVYNDMLHEVIENHTGLRTKLAEGGSVTYGDFNHDWVAWLIANYVYDCAYRGASIGELTRHIRSEKPNVTTTDVLLTVKEKLIPKGYVLTEENVNTGRVYHEPYAPKYSYLSSEASIHAAGGSILNRKTDLKGEKKQIWMKVYEPRKITEKDVVFDKTEGGKTPSSVQLNKSAKYFELAHPADDEGYVYKQKYFIDSYKLGDGKYSRSIRFGNSEDDAIYKAGYTDSVIGSIDDLKKHFVKLYNAELIADNLYHKQEIIIGVELKWYQQAISEGRMTVDDAKAIIESVGLEVPQDILQMAGSPITDNRSPITDYRLPITEKITNLRKTLPHLKGKEKKEMEKYIKELETSNKLSEGDSPITDYRLPITNIHAAGGSVPEHSIHKNHWYVLSRLKQPPVLAQLIGEEGDNYIFAYPNGESTKWNKDEFARQLQKGTAHDFVELMQHQKQLGYSNLYSFIEMNSNLIGAEIINRIIKETAMVTRNDYDNFTDFVNAVFANL